MLPRTKSDAMISQRDELVLVSVSVYILMTSKSKWTLVIVE